MHKKMRLTLLFFIGKGGGSMRIAICDDKVKDQELLTKALKGWDQTKKPECYCDGASFLAAAQKPDQEYIDIAFLDIYILGENGVEIAKKLKRISPETSIVFVSTSEEYAVDAFSIQALHYLIKPVTTEEVGEALRRLRLHSGRKRPMIVLNIGRDSRTVYLDEIIYIQSTRHMKEVFLTDGRQIRVWTPLEELETELGRNFLKLGRGTLVNMEQIEQMGVNTCIVRSGVRLELPRRERTAIHAAYDNFLFTRLSERTGFEEGGRP